jgi:hypothetical protein
MKPLLSNHARRLQRQGYLLMEALVYIGLVVVVLGTAFAVAYRCIDNAVVLRRNAEDVTATLSAGERWRADIRNATASPVVETGTDGQTLRLPNAKGDVLYRFENDTVERKTGEQNWIRLLSNVKSSSMHPDPRQKVTAWTWEVELLPRVKGYNKPGRVRPLFTFVAVPERSVSQ